MPRGRNYGAKWPIRIRRRGLLILFCIWMRTRDVTMGRDGRSRFRTCRASFLRLEPRTASIEKSPVFSRLKRAAQTMDEYLASFELLRRKVESRMQMAESSAEAPVSISHPLRFRARFDFRPVSISGG